MKKNRTRLLLASLILYIGALLCVTLLIRQPVASHAIQTEWLWGYKVDDPSVLYRDNLLNIIVYIPVGCLVACVVPKRRLLAALLCGFLLSQTIETSQLIWHRGVFDVDDIFNNTLGTLLGAIAALSALGINKGKHPRSKH